ncbi:WXG100 family type VII secretion target [Roseiflexus castenholzii]|uniref:WXG100 family type VII secretion target n=1 Tax=Roseiflexus castenholzii TaxID=120962 RepID=UPI003C7C5A84
MLIGADIDQLYTTIALFRRSRAEMSDTFQRALQAMQAMQSSPWSGQNRLRAEAVWERIQAQFASTINELEDLTTRTERFANNLAEAGRSFYDPARINRRSSRRSGEQRSPDTSDAIGDVLKGIEKGIEHLKKIRNSWDALRDFRSMFLVAQGLQIVHGSTYPKQLILKGSDEVFEMAFLNPHLRHFKGERKSIAQKLVLSPTKNATKDAVSGALKALPFEFALNVASNASDNWESYKGDPQHWQKAVVGTAIDATVDTALSAAGTVVGTAVGGAVGGALLGAISGGTLAPLGVAIGARVGGFAGGWAAERVSECLKEQDWYKDLKKVGVQMGADFIDQSVQTAQKTMESVAQEGQRVLEQTQEKVAAIADKSQQLLEQGQQVQQAMSGWVSHKLGLQFR